MRNNNSNSGRNYVSNGRIDIQTPNQSKLFAMYDKIPAKQCTTYRGPTEGLWTDTIVSDTFFSQANIQIIQNGIRAGVYNKSNGQYIIGPQDCDSLKVIMRSIFLQHSINTPENIKEQLEALNKLVLDYCVGQVYGEAQGYMKYVTDVSTLAMPMAHPVLSNQKDKQLQLKPFF